MSEGWPWPIWMGQGRIGGNSVDLKLLDSLLDHFVKVGPKGCGAVVTHRGVVVYEGYAGFADAERRVPATRDMVYRIYSCTKVFTVVAAMQLYEKGLFLLNDPIEQYLPEFAGPKVYVTSGNGACKIERASRSITIRDLMSMRSGITESGTSDKTERQVKALLARVDQEGMTEREFVRQLAAIPLAFQPGSHFRYGYSLDVIGALIEELSGKTLGKYMRDEIFAPLGMTSTGFFADLEPRLGDNLATLYTWADDRSLVPLQAMDSQFQSARKLECASSGLLTTVRDMSRFAAALSMGGTLDGQRILGRKTIDLIRRNQLEGDSLADFQACWTNGWEFLAGYGYGLGVRTLTHPEQGGINASPGEFGWAGMAGTYILADPAEQISICYAHQIYPENMEGYCHPRLKQAVYGALE